MFEDIHNRLFGSIGSKIKTLAKLCCYFCLIVRRGFKGMAYRW